MIAKIVLLCAALAAAQASNMIGTLGMGSGISSGLSSLSGLAVGPVAYPTVTKYAIAAPVTVTSQKSVINHVAPVARAVAAVPVAIAAPATIGYNGNGVINTGIVTGNGLMNTGIVAGNGLMNTGIVSGNGLMNTGVLAGNGLMGSGIVSSTGLLGSGLSLGAISVPAVATKAVVAAPVTVSSQKSVINHVAPVRTVVAAAPVTQVVAAAPVTQVVAAAPASVVSSITTGYSSNGLLNGGIVAGTGLLGSGIINGNGLMGNGIIGNGLMGNGIIGSGLLSNGIIGNGMMGNGINGAYGIASSPLAIGTGIKSIGGIGIGSGLLGGIGSGLIGGIGYGKSIL